MLTKTLNNKSKQEKRMKIKEKIIQLENLILIEKLALIYDEIKEHRGAQYLIRLKYNALIQGKEIPGEYVSSGLIECGTIHKELIEGLYKEFTNTNMISKEGRKTLKTKIDNINQSETAIKVKEMIKNYENTPAIYNDKKELREITATLIDYHNELIELERLILIMASQK